MFRVTSLDLEMLAKSGGPVKYEYDFFGKPAHLTVSGQLNGEAYATALGRIYTFGPTFRAENSNTSRHLAEFWMVEPEAAFFDLSDNMKLAEEFLKRIFRDCLNECEEDMAFFDDRIEKGKIDQLQIGDRKTVRSHDLHRRDQDVARRPPKSSSIRSTGERTCKPSTNVT